MPRFRRSGILTPVITSVAALAVLGGLAVQPDLLNRDTGRDAESAGDSYDWYEDTAAEQLRQDQCLMADVLRLGGPSMATTAQDSLNQTPDKLHTLANREHWQSTPLAQAYQKDKDAAVKELDALHALRGGWQKPVDGLTTPAGFTSADFHWPPGSSGDGKDDFYGQTGLTKWTADRFWEEEDDFYQDTTPKADKKTLKAVDDLGTPPLRDGPGPESSPGRAGTCARRAGRVQVAARGHGGERRRGQRPYLPRLRGLSPHRPAAGHRGVPHRGRGPEDPVRVVRVA
jgi:hypothetical protein